MTAPTVSRDKFMKSASTIMLQIQRDQNTHDLLAHRDILNLDTHTKLKHMTLHFLKYAGKLAEAHDAQSRSSLELVLVDTFIICLATANALNVNLGKAWALSAENLDGLSRCFCVKGLTVDPLDRALFGLVKIAGRMAKAIESTDHLERGNPREDLETLIVELSAEVLLLLGSLNTSIEEIVRARWSAVESKSIFSIN
jgi:hypothetical protein